MRWRFGRFELDSARAELRCDGAIIPVEPQVFEVLRTLIEHRDRVVPHRELMESVWGERVVGPTTVASRVKAARRAVGDDGRRQHVIATVHGRGYRFVAELHEPGRSDPPGESVTTGTPSVGSGRGALVDEIADAYAAGAAGVALTGGSSAELDVVADAVAQTIAGRHGAVVEQTITAPSGIAFGAVAHLIGDHTVAPSMDPDLDRARALRSSIALLGDRWRDPAKPVLVVRSRADLDALSRALVDAVIAARSAFVIEIAAQGSPASGLVARGVTRLDDDAVRSMAEAVLAGRATDRFVVELAAACDGSVARAREIIDASVAAGSLVEVDGAWDVIADLVSEISTPWPPPDLHADAVLAAELIALAGSLDAATLGLVVDQRSIDELDGRRLVVADGGAERLRIASPLVRAAIDSSLTPLRRERLRSRLASATNSRLDQD